MKESFPGQRLPDRLRPSGEKSAVEEYPVKVERMEGELVRRNSAFPELRSLSDEQMLDFAHFAVDPEHPDGVWVDHRPGHNRSFVWSESDIEDDEGRNLGKLNIKGTGFVSLGGGGPALEAFKGRHILPEQHRRTLRPKKLEAYEYTPYNKGMYGLMSREDAEVDYDNGERFSALGVRTSRGVAIIKLKTVFYPGRGIVDVEDLERKGVIPAGFEPVVYVRAVGADHRIRDYEDPEFFPRSNRAWLRERKTAALSSAIERVGQEIGREGLSMEEYLRWFAQTLGEQVGILHRNGYAHQGLFKRPTGYVHPTDITLDCRLLDLDNTQTSADVQAKLEKAGLDVSMTKAVHALKMKQDIEAAKNSLEALLASCRDASPLVPEKGAVPPSAKDDLFLAEMFSGFDAAYAQTQAASPAG